MKLRFTRPALKDLDEVLDYIASRSPQGARRIQSRIKAAIDLLLEFPHIGAPTNDPQIRRTRAHPYPYLIFLRGYGR